MIGDFTKKILYPQQSLGILGLATNRIKLITNINCICIYVNQNRDRFQPSGDIYEWMKDCLVMEKC